MKKILAWYKGLPREVQTALALLGLGTPTGIIFMIKRHFFANNPRVGYVEITFGFAIGVILLSLICWALAALFTARQKKRSRRMVADLTREDQAAPASMDVKAAIKSNNEKFFTAVRDMKKNLGVSVYDLPWYIVIGDSGCGKTRLINNGGLTFSTGKPEGYQLGTLNYNWWFTEDAVFIDMAGRLCNPQEDSDHREWQAFLETIARGRKGFPINGAFVCISAEHLLSDSPEKHEADANTALERLRELQARLGVTFATYLIITKCDKILGFMQFFDRAERDITVKNQIFGWAKPGEFNQLYDPEDFPADFNDLYNRLNDLRLRRLHDDVSEADLGLAYSFPEEFRQLRDSLHTYVRTLFPMIRNPRAMKNLIFRGLFFTSATQEGAVILKHLAQRLGAQAAEQFPSLDQLYPEKRPLFVKDVFFRKAFPEQGLVFRNENDVVRSQKLARIVKFGSVALSVLLISALTWSFLSFKKLIGQPRENARQAAMRVSDRDQSLALSAALGKDVANLNANQLAQRVLSFPFAFNPPAESIRAIRAGAFEHSQIRPVLGDAVKELTSPDAWTSRGASCRDALVEYVRWWGCAAPESPPARPDKKSFDAFVAALGSEHVFPVAAGGTNADGTSADFAALIQEYFNVLSRSSDWHNAFRLLPGDSAERAATFRRALQLAHDKYWKTRATLLDNHENPFVRNWMTIDSRCRAARKAYDDLLSLRTHAPRTREEWKKLQSDFTSGVQQLAAALDGVKWDLTGAEKGLWLRDAVANLRKEWIDYQKKLLDARNACARADDPQFAAILEEFIRGGEDMTGVDAVLCAQLKARDLLLPQQPCNTETLANLPGEGVIHEVASAWNYMMTTSGFGQPDAQPVVTLTADAVALRTRLEEMSRDLSGAGGTNCADDPDPLICWANQIKTLRREDSAAHVKDVTLAHEFAWMKKDFLDLQHRHREWLQQGQGTLLLTEVSDALRATKDVGFAELYPQYLDMVPAAYTFSRATPAPAPPPEEPPPAGETPSRTRTRTEPATPATPPPESSRSRAPQRDRAPSTAPRSAGTSVPWPSAFTGEIPAWMSHEFLDANLVGMSDLILAVEDLTASQITENAVREDALRQARRAAQNYLTRYVGEWVRLYDARTLADLRPLRETGTWSALAAALADGALRTKIQGDVTAALGQALQAVPYALWYADKVWVEPGSGGRNRFWDDVRSWRRDALAAAAPGRLNFLTQTPMIDEQVRRALDIRPEQSLARDIGQEWTRLADAVAVSRDLPRRFNEQSPRFPNIAWGGIQKKRVQYGLADEKLTAELVALEDHAKSLLDAELSAILRGLQDAHAVRTGAGLPSAGTNLVAFRSFLDEVSYAQSTLKGLEEGLSTPNSQRRASFYDQCRKWREFLSGPLRVDVSGDDPFNNRDKYPPLPGDADTPAQLYNTMQIYLGLEKSGGGALSGAEVEWEARSDQWVSPRSGLWTWSSGSTPMKFILSRGKPTEIRDEKGKYVPGPPLPDVESEFGQASSLSLVAYLLDSGKSEPTRDKWYVLQSIDLRSKFRDNQAVLNLVNSPALEKSRVLVMGFIIKLDRPLPPRIDPL